MTVPSPPGLRAEGLQRSFGPVHAVRDLSLEVRRGEVVGLLGPNGAGKSTTLRLLAGFLEPDAGAASIAGHDVVRARRAAQGATGYLPEGAPAWPGMSARGLVDFVARVHGLDAGERAARLAAIAARLELAEVLDRPVDRLSKGFRRRVGLAAALVHDPPVLLLDEPTDGLDPNQKRALRAALRAAAAGPEGKAILVSTHLLEEVESLCDRVVLVARGAVAFRGTPAELRGLSPSGDLDDAFRRATEAPA